MFGDAVSAEWGIKYHHHRQTSFEQTFPPSTFPQENSSFLDSKTGQSPWRSPFTNQIDIHNTKAIYIENIKLDQGI
jgi:hypothetical protein